MKDIYRNPILYYALIPVLAALWPLALFLVYLPRAEQNMQDEEKQYARAQEVITEILTLDPERLEFADSNAAASEFDYATVVDRIANSCGIPATDYKVSSKPPRTSSSGQKSQTAKITINQADIARFARFLSSIQFRWPGLQCETVVLTKAEGVPDRWKADLDFRYYY
jgi:hypothetical protein